MIESGTLPITSAGILRITSELREWYLTPQTNTAIVQATGRELWIWIASDRSNIKIRLPIEGFRAGRPYRRSIHRWGVNVSKWLEPGSASDGPAECSTGVLAVEHDERSGRDVIGFEIDQIDETLPF